MRCCNDKKSFTLMEILVVVIIISIMTGFGMTNYYKAQERSYLKNAMSQLKTVKKAQEMYYIKEDIYYPPNVTAGPDNDTVLDTGTLNVDLNLYIIDKGFVYGCLDQDDDQIFKCVARRDGGKYDIEVTESTDPVCVDQAESCP